MHGYFLQFIETPPNNDMGDFALPCFKLSKIMRLSPIKIAEDLANAFIVDDVISTGASLIGLEKLIEKAGGIVHKKAFVLAEADAADRKDVIYLASIPIFG